MNGGTELEERGASSARTTTSSQRRTARAATLAAAILTASFAAACAEQAPQLETPRTDGTTANLLSAASAEGGMSAMGPGGETVPAGRDIDVALLGFNYGPDEALVRVVEFSDYGCGYCRKFHQETWPTLLSGYVESGKVQWKFLPFVTGMFGNSPVVTEGAECALAQSEDLFGAVSEGLWDNQAAWKGGGDPHAVVRGLARGAGADMGRWDTCMREDERNDRVLAATALARQLGVRGTPTFFVVGYPPIQGALPTETFQKILDLVYEEAQTRGGG